MKTVNWLDVYDMVVDKKKQVKEDMNEIIKLSREGKINATTYLKFRIATDTKLDVLNELLIDFDEIEINKGGD